VVSFFAFSGAVFSSGIRENYEIHEIREKGLEFVSFGLSFSPVADLREVGD
jgi:hypothetical protein